MDKQIQTDFRVTKAAMDHSEKALARLDWRDGFDSQASRHDKLGKVTSDLIAHFASTLAALGNAGLDRENDEAFQYFLDVIQDAWDDQFVGDWLKVEKRAEYATSPAGRAEDRADAAYQAAAERRVA